jgi:hypothetical protein
MNSLVSSRLKAVTIVDRSATLCFPRMCWLVVEHSVYARVRLSLVAQGELKTMCLALLVLLVSDPVLASLFFIGSDGEYHGLVEATARGRIPTCGKGYHHPRCVDPPGQSATQNRRNDNIAIQRHARA